MKDKRWLPLVLSVVGAAMVYGILKYYENYLVSILPAGSSYKSSEGIHLSDPVFRETLARNFTQRYRFILLHILVYAAPLAIVFYGSLFKNFKTSIIAIVSLISFCIAYLFFKEVNIPFQNVFMNMALGPETFYESFNAIKVHNYSELFFRISVWVKYLLSGISINIILLILLSLYKNKKIGIVLIPEIVFLIAFVTVYAMMLFITESYFDRYHIPFVTVALILLIYSNRRFTINYKFALIPLLCFIYISVFGTKDYLSWNRLRWEAYEDLKKNEGVKAVDVNGGFELNCWNDLEANWWYNYTDLSTFKYLIQFRREPGFKLLKEYEFQRYFPYKKDKICVYERDIPENLK